MSASATSVCAAPSGYVDPAHLLRIAKFAEGLKDRLDALMDPRPGQRLLDIGCGPGTDTLRLAAAVAPGGSVMGVDIDPEMVALAAQRAHRSPESALVRHAVANAACLPYRSGSFDACRCERVLQHVADPRTILAEIARVTRVGGIIAAADSDWASLSIHADDPRLERHIVSAVAGSFCNGYVGRQLRDLFTGAGLQDVVVETWPIHWNSYRQFAVTSFMAAGIHRRLLATGVLDAGAWQRFTTMQEEIDARGGFLATATVVLVAGRNRRALEGGRPCAANVS
jgi:ubiquinone/menaquinone biosynthesis C-methylase UbiE